MLTKKELKELIQKSKKSGYAPNKISWVNKNPKWTPLYYMKEAEGVTPVKTVAITAVITSADDSHINYVSVGFNGEKWFLTVGNPFISGDIPKDSHIAFLCDNEKEKEDMEFLYSEVMCTDERETSSDFWRKWYSEKKLNNIAKVFLHSIEEEQLDSIENYFYGQDRKEETEEGLIAARMELYSFKRHLLFIGEKGSGKTYDIYSFIEKHRFPHIFIGGNPDIEAIDLKGNLLPFEKNGEKNFIWIDGPLTQAFRRASQGEKIILFIDELLRMSRSAQSLLVPALTTDNQGNYVLDTGRVIDVINGVGKTEIIKAPVENLWVLATTNMGAEYNVPDMESALEDRFEIIEKNNDLEKIKKILTNIAKEKGYSLSIVDKMIQFYESMIRLKDEEIINKLINLRHLAQALEDTREEGDLYDRLCDRTPKWVERDIKGRLFNSQVETIKKALKKADIR